jgi:hypothetical protein
MVPMVVALTFVSVLYEIQRLDQLVVLLVDMVEPHPLSAQLPLVLWLDYQLSY